MISVRSATHRKTVFILGACLFFLSIPSADLFAAVSPPSSSARASQVPSTKSAGGASELSYVIGPQNLLQVKIFGDANQTQIYRVDELGFITHYLVGRIRLGGYSVAEAEKVMEQKLVGDYILNPHVTIFVLEHSHFSVLGEVRKPGTYEIMGRVSIIEAISMAGGFTPVANQGDVKIIRKQEGQEAAIKVDTTRITQRGDMSAQVYLEADDVVSVPKSFF